MSSATITPLNRCAVDSLPPIFCAPQPHFHFVSNIFYHLDAVDSVDCWAAFHFCRSMLLRTAIAVVQQQGAQQGVRIRGSL
ncbi:hypothetical protein Y032_0007g3248 [Ancylostoma ceylanicum]|uniref:Uncharacterized protein n=1 Tax=Ancylostoma ceylanicum TaxID=53326 RepID=A0A016VLK9_9BILA|nr:hypothetical protein Y032_0007g3248 [Ancylostoma ceylanicum]